MQVNDKQALLSWAVAEYPRARARKRSAGLICGVTCAIIKALPSFSLSGVAFIDGPDVWPLVRIYRGGFLLIEFLFLLGINTYGWRQAGVNHVLIFELNPRSNLSHQHLFEVNSPDC